ncbi:MAG: pepT [Clostridiales bacterium]|nr:pepT [Clostridiales bacterium]
MGVTERFLKYVTYNTKSDEESTTIPSTKNQLVLGEELGKELKEIGMQDVSLDKNGYIMATLPSNMDSKVPTIGFIAHMDTSPDMPGENIKPKLVKNYDGGDIILNKDKNIVLSPNDFSDLKDYVGKDLITTDGTTLLGADDKAGVAEIISAMEYLINHPEIKHGAIKIGFTPDEEVGRGADYFDVEKFDADFAYTLDGGAIGELEYENFNAAGAKVIITGTNIHPGSAKDKMKSSLLISNVFISMLPEDETPGTTEGYEGFYHLNTIKGDVERTELNYIIRDFDKDSFQNRKALMKKIADKLNEKYGEGTIFLEIKDQYFNMKEIIEQHKHIVDIAFNAMKECGVTPKVVPIRGGTDGARLSFMGLPTPNLFTGGHNFHGRYEFIPVFAMKKAVEVILKIVELGSK